MLTKGLILCSRVLKLKRLISRRSRKDLQIRAAMMNKLYEKFWPRVVAKNNGSLVHLRNGICRISIGDAKTFVRGSHVQLDDHLTLELAGDKPLVYQLLREIGLRCLPHYCVYSIQDVKAAVDFLGASTGPVVVKPAYGTGAGAGVFSNISTKTQLFRATAIAASFCKELIVEDQYKGRSYRLLFLDGAMIDAIERSPPTVTGDGKSTISKLIEDENKTRRQAAGMRSTSLLVRDDEMRRCLRSQGLTLRSNLEKGETVVLKNVINQNNALENRRVFDDVHKSFVELGEQVVRQLNIRLAGLDIIAHNIDQPAQEQAHIINDVNTTPGLHHHVLVSEPDDRFDVGTLILNRVLCNAQRCTR